MVNTYRIVILKSAQKDKEKIQNNFLIKEGYKTIPALKRNVENLLEVLRNNPFQNPPPYEKLKGSLGDFYSRRINAQHRLVYRVIEKEKTIMIVSMWSHYEF